MSLNRIDPQFAADVLGKPSGNLHPSDVVADRVMGAGLGHQNSVAGTKPLDGGRPFDKLAQIALLPAKRIENEVIGTSGGVSASTSRTPASRSLPAPAGD